MAAKEFNAGSSQNPEESGSEDEINSSENSNSLSDTEGVGESNFASDKSPSEKRKLLERHFCS
jgi:hypothetical protein